MYRVAALALLCALYAAPVHAQGTPEQREACQGDAFTFCGQFIPDVESTKACLIKNLKKISRPCQAVFAAARRKK